MRSPYLPGLQTLTAILLVTAAYSVSAQDSDISDFSLGIFAGYEDNPRQLANGSKEETVGGLQGDLTLDINRRLYDLDMGYEIDHTRYFNDTFNDKTEIRGSGTALFGTESSPVKWLLSNSQQQVLRGSSSTTRPTPQSTAQRSTTETGPIAQFNFAGTESIQARYLYRLTEVEDNDNDVESYIGLIKWRHLFSSLLSSELGLQSTETELTDFEDSTFKTERLSLGFTRLIKDGALLAEVGRSRSTRELSRTNDQVNGSTLTLLSDREFEFSEVKLQLNKAISGHRFRVLAQRTQSDSTQGLEAEIDSLRFDLGSQEFELQKRSRVDLRWSGPSVIPQTDYALALSHINSESFATEDTDTASRASFNLNRRLSTRTELGLTLAYSDFKTEQTADTGSLDSDRQAHEARLNYKHTLTRSTTSECDLRYVESKGSIEFDATAVRCSLNAKIF